MATEIMKAKSNDRMMDTWAVQQLVRWAGGKTGTKQTKEALRQEMKTFAAELAGPAPSPIEQVLAETAALNWFALRLAEAQWASASTSEHKISVKQLDHYQQRIDRAHRRLMSTLKTLATVRRLGVPAIQVNLANQQVNLVTST